MAGFADSIRGYSEQTRAGLNEYARQVIFEAGRRLVARSPIGAPETWKSKPPKDYVPGNFVSNWNYGLMSPDLSTTAQTGIRTVNYIDEVPAEPIGFVHYLTNATPYGPALEAGHSGQAPMGIVALTELEMPQIQREAARSAIILGGLSSAVQEVSSGI